MMHLLDSLFNAAAVSMDFLLVELTSVGFSAAFAVPIGV
jgi:hypothetical protein